MVDGLKDPKFLRHTLQCPVVIVLQWDLLHGHDVPGLVIDGSVNLPKVALTNFDTSLPGEFDLSCSDMNLVFSDHFVKNFAWIIA